MKSILTALLPAQADYTIHGMKLPVYVFTVIAMAGLARSSIHLLARDGGAGSIAGLDLSAGEPGIILAFARSSRRFCGSW
ncbi:MAG: hypothetical protein ABSC93_11625 [Bryobacteraceae bacterium]|jgi:hypothetical protein